MGGWGRAPPEPHPPTAGGQKHSQLQPRFVAHILRRPRRIPDKIDLGIADAGDRADAQFDFGGHRLRDRAMRRRQRHRDERMAVVDLDIIDEAKVIDIHRDFRVVDVLERIDHGLVQVAADRMRIDRSGLGREEAFEIVALALEFLGRRLDIRDACLRRCLDAFHFLDLDHPVLAHPKILSTRARPSISAATSSSLL